MKNKFENRSEIRCGSFLYILYEVFFIPYEKISLKIKKDENKRFSIKRRPIIFCLYLCEKRKRGEYKIFCVNEKIHTKKEVPSVE
ncbi:hypothetical protein V5235_12390 [Enterococcus faecium]|uniref:hypothetical protein n=2 Tax=Enterococcus faecium TaxID=1352 RepID=UPI0029661922|nr:hypothetical protein [Enterococcus faecium]MDW3030746.1 hypothetical protein [Enterococcus faecium]